MTLARVVLILVVVTVEVFAPAAIGKAEGLVTGKLLVATDEMPDPRFAETVIFMVQHGPEGALGVVLNRPIDTLPIADILQGFGVEDVAAEGDLVVYAGGPVFADRGFVLHSADYAQDGTLVVDDDIALTRGIQPLVDRLGGRGPSELRLFLGLASWGPSQLEGELVRPGWIVVPADLAIVFSTDIDTLWQRALAREGIDL